MHPYVYVQTNKSRPVQREAPYGARVAISYPELGRTIDLWTNSAGHWTLTDLPGPITSGAEIIVARGQLRKDCPGSYNDEDSLIIVRAAEFLSRVQAGEDVPPASSALAHCVSSLREMFRRMNGTA